VHEIDVLSVTTFGVRGGFYTVNSGGVLTLTGCSFLTIKPQLIQSMDENTDFNTSGACGHRK